jgi:hypothetical protein
MGIEEYQFLTKTLSDISSLSIELDSENKVLGGRRASKKEKEAEIGDLEEQLVFAANSTEEELESSRDEMVNEIKEMKSKLRIDNDTLAMMEEPVIVALANSKAQRVLFKFFEGILSWTIIVLLLVMPAVVVEEDYDFQCVTDGETVGPFQVLDGDEDCSDGSDEWGNPDVAQHSRPAEPTEAEIYLLDVFPEYESFNDFMFTMIIGSIFIWPLVLYVIIKPRLLRAWPRHPRKLWLLSYLVMHDPEKYLEELGRLESETKSSASEIAEKDVQTIHIERNLRFNKNNPKKIDKGRSELVKLEEQVDVNMKRISELESSIETKWDSIRHLIPYSEMLDNQDS